MPKAKTHKIAVRTKGLSHEDAARLHYLIACAASTFSDDYETAGNVPLKTLRTVFPDGSWHLARRQDRLDLVM